MSLDSTTDAPGLRVLPTETIPTGWYQIGWSEEFAAGEVKPMRYFERDLVAFRGGSGSLHVLDAYCPHMGAHLGYGGRVRGNDIQCPYHSWRWSGESGENTHIPYGDKPCMRLSVPSWSTRELDGVAFMFYSPSRCGPTFELPEHFAPSGDVWHPYPGATEVWRNVPLVPQLPAENVPDAAHFTSIHRAPTMPTLTRYSPGAGYFQTDWDIRFGGEKATWATPHGPVDGHIVTRTWGLGLGWNIQTAFDEVTSLSGYTPVDRRTSDVRLTVWTPRNRTDGSPLGRNLRDRWFEFQKGQIGSDMVIWSNQTYIRRVPFASTEAPAMRALRQWSTQFYESI